MSVTKIIHRKTTPVSNMNYTNISMSTISSNDQCPQYRYIPYTAKLSRKKPFIVWMEMVICGKTSMIETNNQRARN